VEFTVKPGPTNGLMLPGVSKWALVRPRLPPIYHPSGSSASAAELAKTARAVRLSLYGSNDFRAVIFSSFE
jgi:hypothetical protein